MLIQNLRRTVVAVAVAALLSPAAGSCLTQRPPMTHVGAGLVEQFTSAFNQIVRFVLEVGISMDGNG
jgi:hypothetical protein